MFNSVNVYLIRCLIFDISLIFDFIKLVQLNKKLSPID